MKKRVYFDFEKKMINKEINFKNIIIYWKPWAGKSLICNAIISWYSRIYSNLDFYKNWKKLNTSITDVDNLEYITYKDEPWIIIIDEGGINVSSRMSMSKDNRKYSQALFLGRKKNCRIVWISQLADSLDKNIRKLADLTIKMHKIRRYEAHPLFIIEKQIMYKNNYLFSWEWKIDLIKFMNITGRTYDTLQSSILKKTEEKKSIMKTWFYQKKKQGYL